MEKKSYFHVWYGDNFESSADTIKDVNDLYETIAERDGEIYPNSFDVFKVEKVDFKYRPEQKEE